MTASASAAVSRVETPPYATNLSLLPTNIYVSLLLVSIFFFLREAVNSGLNALLSGDLRRVLTCGRDKSAGAGCGKNKDVTADTGAFESLQRKPGVNLFP